MTDRDRRLAMIAIWAGIAAGSAALGEVIYLAVRWIVTGRP